MALISGTHRSGARRRIAGALIDLAREVGARVIAEGIDAAADHEAALALGIDCGQGHRLGIPTERLARPAAADTLTG